MNSILVVETLLSFVIAVTVHEMGHAALATMLGDDSQVNAGRLSFSPARQMSFVGSLVALIVAVGGAPAGFGWGRPVDVSVRRLRVGPNLGTSLIALAGPAVNLILAFAVVGILNFMPNLGNLERATSICLSGAHSNLAGRGLQECLVANSQQPAALLRLEQFLFALAVTNFLLAILNIIPLRPLDGYTILYALLPDHNAIALQRYEPYMEAILLVLFFLLPLLANLLRLPLNLAAPFIRLAATIAASLTHDAFDFYALL